MGLVDYSESDSSDVEVDAPQPVAKAAAPKKPAFQKVVDRSNPGKIVLNLPQVSSSGDAGAANSNEPPAKRARTGGGGLFSGFSSFLPPPKNTGKPILGKSLSRPGINLKTSAEKGFSRDEEPPSSSNSNTDGASGLSLPPPKRPAEPSIPDTMKPAEDVKLVGKPLLFKPLSVARNTKRKPKSTAATQASTASAPKPVASTQETAAPAPAPPKKTSLFSMHVEEESAPTAPAAGGAYEPLFETGEAINPYGPGAFSQQMHNGQAAAASRDTRTESLDNVADDLNLSAAARRELFGRGGGDGQMAKKVINFNMDREYQHNEELRAAGEQQTHNPVRAIHGGKHSLQQLVRNVASQRDALEESFAKGKSNRREASSRYGW
ncbi:hypothetical protein MKX08_005383 [Trichoderma sp. CBMAI-0020]|nr:hypothetical protein MKX08_005383 [Trichoderma sp. CBMAI-0020]